MFGDLTKIYDTWWYSNLVLMSSFESVKLGCLIWHIPNICSTRNYSYFFYWTRRVGMFSGALRRFAISFDEFVWISLQESVQFRASFMGPLPLQEYYELIDAHFEVNFFLSFLFQLKLWLLPPALAAKIVNFRDHLAYGSCPWNLNWPIRIQ